MFQLPDLPVIMYTVDVYIRASVAGRFVMDEWVILERERNWRNVREELWNFRDGAWVHASVSGWVFCEYRSACVWCFMSKLPSAHGLAWNATDSALSTTVPPSISSSTVAEGMSSRGSIKLSSRWRSRCVTWGNCHVEDTRGVTPTSLVFMPVQQNRHLNHCNKNHLTFFCNTFHTLEGIEFCLLDVHRLSQIEESAAQRKPNDFNQGN
jgi:hypothetical protein